MTSEQSAPQVCSERPYSWASDIWAMGCVMFELYQLKVPSAEARRERAEPKRSALAVPFQKLGY